MYEPRQYMVSFHSVMFSDLLETFKIRRKTSILSSENYAQIAENYNVEIM